MGESLPMPSMQTMELFKRELWKDQRRLEARTVDGVMAFEKYFSSTLEVATEAALIRELGRRLTIAEVPEVLSESHDHLVFPYIYGIRLFNLLVELDKVEPPLDTIATALKERLLLRAEANQREIQRVLMDFVPKTRALSPYPAAEKIGSIVEVLSKATGIVVETRRMRQDLDLVDELWAPMAQVPFRDATTKNMVLAEPSLWLGNFDSEEARRRHLIATLSADGEEAWVDAPIFDFDFSSCAEDSTLEDDPISLRYHERTWSGYPSAAEELVWNGLADGSRAALTFVVRYYRFGGRKAAYRLLHPSAHRVRFRHDNDVFYFQRLPSVVLSLWPEAARLLPELLEFTRTVARFLEGGRPQVDHFMAAGLGEKRRYYVDMYPD